MVEQSTRPHRALWQKILIALALCAALCFAGTSLYILAQPVGPGDSSMIAFAALVFFGVCAVGCVLLALWISYWHIKAIRWIGLALIIGGPVSYLLTSELDRRKQVAQQQDLDRQIAEIEAEIDVFAARYLERLIAEKPDWPGLHALIREFETEELGAYRKGLHPLSPMATRLRAQASLYEGVFLDPAFNRMTPYWLNQYECLVFLDAFEGLYDPQKHGAKFDGYCADFLPERAPD